MLRWFEEDGNNGDVVIASRVRLARNIQGYNFSCRLSSEDAGKMVNETFDKFNKVDALKKYNTYNFDDLDIYQKMAMKERHVISEFLETQETAAGFVSPDEDISIMLNEEDHIRIQAHVAGMNMDKAYTLVDKIDDELGNAVDYSFDSKFGYLTTCPSNAGTGMRVSYMLHLPALSGNDKIGGLISEVGRFGIMLRAVEGDNKRALGDIYRLSNQATLGKSEHEIIDNLDNIADQIIEQERNYRNTYIKKKRLQAEDLTYRSYGVLKYARKVSLKDGMLLLSQLRFGIATGIVKPVTDIGNSIYQLMIGIHPANLLMISNHDLTPEEVDVARADFIRNNLPTIQ